MRRAWLVCIAFWASACIASAQKAPALPKELPPYGPLVPFRAPQVMVRKLDNGLTLWLVPRPGFPKVALVLATQGGLAADPKDRPGLAELLLATIDQGTTTRSARQIAEEVEAAGGDLTGNALSDYLVAATDVLSSKLPDVLPILADIAQHATFPDSEVELAKRNAADNLRAQEAEPNFLARRALAKAVYGDHPYSVMAPTQESIAATQAAELRREYARRLRPDTSILVAVGDFDAGSLTEAIGKAFGAWKAPAEVPTPLVAPPTGQNPHAVFIVPRPGSVQTEFMMAAFAPKEGDADYAAVQVANAIYGGMFGSRLIKNIREDKGYTYSPRAFLSPRRQADLLQTSAAVRNPVTGASFNEINYELNRMATTAPAADELERAQRYLVGIQAIQLQSQMAVAMQLARLWAFGLPPEQLQRESENVQRVTVKDVEAAGQKYFPASRETIVAVGEEKVIREQLAPFGITMEPAPKPD
jgi:zinc protease